MNIFIEGARGVGKSTLVRGLRNNRMERVLINHTGLNKDSIETKQKVLEYYKELNKWLGSIEHTGYTMLHDRFFLSETVMSKTYKTTYDFDKETNDLMIDLSEKLSKALVILVYNPNEDDLARNFSNGERLTKANLFERKDILDNAENSLKQQDVYKKYFDQLKELNLPNITYIEFSTEGKTIEQSLEELETIIEDYKNNTI